MNEASPQQLTVAKLRRILRAARPAMPVRLRTWEQQELRVLGTQYERDDQERIQAVVVYVHALDGR